MEVVIATAITALAGVIVALIADNRKSHGKVEAKLDQVIDRVDTMSVRQDHLAARLDIVLGAQTVVMREQAVVMDQQRVVMVAQTEQTDSAA